MVKKLKKINYNKKYSRFSPLFEKVIQLNRLEGGEILSFSIPADKDGLSFKLQLIDIKHDGFICDFKGEDTTYFPARIRALASFLKHNNQFGKFNVSHQGGDFTLQKVTSYSTNQPLKNRSSMSRKKFMESVGASNRNDRYGWAYVNHNEKFVVFGAWDIFTELDRALIFSLDWEHNELGRKQNGFGEAMEYIQLIENEGYSLKTFPIIMDEEYYNSSGTAKIKDYVAKLSDMSLTFENENYYALGQHESEYSKKSVPSIAQDVLKIFGENIDKTERETLVLARIGQGRFRQNVIDAWGNGERCALTLTNIREMLIASHIMPWSKCSSDKERLDGANGILLCAHVDKLFDAHLLTFAKQGAKFVSKLSPKIDSSLLKGLGIESGYELSVDKLSRSHRERFEVYLATHNFLFEQKANI